jgi:hypothetical protein
VAGSAIVGELTLTPAFDLLPHRLELHRILPSQMSMASARTKCFECLASTGAYSPWNVRFNVSSHTR